MIKMKYDVFIPSAPKDYTKLPFVVSSIRRFLIPQPENIYIVSPTRPQVDPQDEAFHNVWFCNEKKVLDLDISLCKFRRARWVYAMALKLWQNITENENYFVVDADLIYLKPFELFSRDDNPYFFFAWDQNHKQYFNLLQKLYNIPRLRKSFICEMMMFNKRICKELLLDMNIEEYWKMVCDIIDDGSKYMLDDYDFYGNYVMQHYPILYEHKDISLNLSGKSKEEYSAEEIQLAINKCSEGTWSCITIHTWL